LDAPPGYGQLPNEMPATLGITNWKLGNYMIVEKYIYIYILCFLFGTLYENVIYYILD
jgi:hypothetical protein